MGMGKTLSMLALSLQTLQDGQAWAEERRQAPYADGRGPTLHTLYFGCRAGLRVSLELPPGQSTERLQRKGLTGAKCLSSNGTKRSKRML